MRLLGGERKPYILALLFFGLLAILPLVPSVANEHTLLGISTKDISKISQPLEQLVPSMEQLGVKLKDWSVIWKDQVTAQQEEQLIQLLENEGFQLIESEQFLTPHQVLIKKSIWQKLMSESSHQIEFIHYPTTLGDEIKFIYGWSGTSLPSNWLTEYDTIHTLLSAGLQKDVQNYTCLTGISNDTLIDDFVDGDNVTSLIANQFQGKTVDHVWDGNFFSMNAYVPSWQETFVYGDRQVNLQLSARYNALDQQTLVTIGYPLILAEH